MEDSWLVSSKAHDTKKLRASITGDHDIAAASSLVRIFSNLYPGIWKRKWSLFLYLQKTVKPGFILSIDN